jgi:hypothetical protein
MLKETQRLLVKPKPKTKPKKKTQAQIFEMPAQIFEMPKKNKRRLKQD